MATETTMKIAVLGAGSYGTALACVLAAQGHRIVMYARDEAQVQTINSEHRNPKRLSDVQLDPLISATAVVSEAVDGASLILHAVPAQHTPQFVRQHAAVLPVGVPYVSTVKGIHVESHMLMSDAIPEAMGGRATDGVQRAEVPIAYLSGPSFAKEMAAGHPISVVVASHDSWCAQRVQDIMSSQKFRVYISDDVVGVEVGGALKNPLAIGAGIAAGLGFGQSTLAGLITRGCHEMAMLAVALGGRAETLSGLSGVGDLMLTCFSSLSRNNRFGGCIAKGMTADEGFAEIGEVVEGYPTAGEVVRLAKIHNLRLPLFFAVDEILSGRLSPQDALATLMTSAPGHENFGAKTSGTKRSREE